MNRDRRTNRTSNFGRPPPAQGANRRSADNAQLPAARSRRWSGGAAQCATVEAHPAPAWPGRIRSVLVPLDGTAAGEQALPLAAGIARRAGAELRVAHVHAPPGADEPPVRHYFPDDWRYLPDGLCGRSRASRQAYLDEVADCVARVTGAAATPLLYDGREVAATLRSAAAGADLVVMATRGRGPLGRLWHGSVVRDLVRHAGPPVLVVPGGTTPPALGAEPAVRRVLVPLDGTAEAEQVLAPAAALGKLLGADFTLMRALPLRYLERPDPAGHALDGLSWPADVPRPRASDALKRSAERLAAQGFGVATEVVFDDRPAASAVLESARRGAAGLIALTLGRRGALSRFVFGSTAERVIRAAAVPVLVSRPRGD